MCPQRPRDALRQGHREVKVRRLGRSINFYDLALGFEVEQLIGDPRTPRAVLRNGDGNRIVLREQKKVASGEAVACLTLAVSGLDARRDTLWDLGIPASRGSGAADRMFGGADRRAFYLRDPDGNELRLVEKSVPARRLTRR